MTKQDYVASQSLSRDHHCHWTGCTRQVPPAMWGCKIHWFKLPAAIRAAIWRTYRPGQEIDGDPSEKYIAAATAARDWIAKQQS